MLQPFPAARRWSQRDVYMAGAVSASGMPRSLGQPRRAVCVTEQVRAATFPPAPGENSTDRAGRVAEPGTHRQCPQAGGLSGGSCRCSSPRPLRNLRRRQRSPGVPGHSGQSANTARAPGAAAGGIREPLPRGSGSRRRGDPGAAAGGIREPPPGGSGSRCRGDPGAAAEGIREPLPRGSGSRRRGDPGAAAGGIREPPPRGSGSRRRGDPGAAAEGIPPCGVRAALPEMAARGRQRPRAERVPPQAAAELRGCGSPQGAAGAAGPARGSEPSRPSGPLVNPEIKMVPISRSGSHSCYSAAAAAAAAAALRRTGSPAPSRAPQPRPRSRTRELSELERAVLSASSGRSGAAAPGSPGPGSVRSR
ncbi:collagen alpha-1(I) chain-like [Malurus melanocephalus]|uniref:collagen alpha-1(I) chain-like n=1 Tax=Malurus melanocephalus TaxID=175006 RepID=UPI0025487596|nr:collagen alpha-1(I) chain-like [Malurus melanocephalus]